MFNLKRVSNGFRNGSVNLLEIIRAGRGKKCQLVEHEELNRKKVGPQRCAEFKTIVPATIIYYRIIFLSVTIVENELP